MRVIERYQGDILPGLAAKQPKTVAGCTTALKEIIRYVSFTHRLITPSFLNVVCFCSQFGVSATAPAPVLKALPKIFAHTDKAVRAEGTQLTYSLYQYLGPGIESWLADLKPVQVKELKEAFEAMEKDGKGKGTLKPVRMTKAAAREAELNEANGGGEEAESPPEEGVSVSSCINSLSYLA